MLENSYEIEIYDGFVLLELNEGEKTHYRPSEGDDVYDSLFFHAIYGGDADPEQPADFVTFTITWPEELEEVEEEHALLLGEELDLQFDGWVISEDLGRVYIVS